MSAETKRPGAFTRSGRMRHAGFACVRVCAAYVSIEMLVRRIGNLLQQVAFEQARALLYRATLDVGAAVIVKKDRYSDTLPHFEADGSTGVQRFVGSYESEM